MKKMFTAALFCILLTPFLFPAGEAETGRDSTSALVDSGSYVASSYLDLDAILDDYPYPYTVEAGKSLGIDVSQMYSSIIPSGGIVDLQLALRTNSADSFEKRDFNYCVYINDSDILSNKEYLEAIEESIGTVFKQKTAGSKVYFFHKSTRTLVEIESSNTINQAIRNLAAQTRGTVFRNISEYIKEAKDDLERLLAAELDNSNPAKYFWLFSKPVADSQNDVDHIFGSIAALGNSQSEISFCGISSDFRASTVNRIVQQFGGNSYYIESAEELQQQIVDDYTFYQRPAVSNLIINIYGLTANSRSDLIKTIRIKSMGVDEYHTFLIPLLVPSMQFIGEQNKEDLAEALPTAFITVEYYDHALQEYQYASSLNTIRYTNDYQEQMNSRDRWVYRNSCIRDTYKLISEISGMLQRNRIESALLQIAEQIEKLEYLQTGLQDDMIKEDIALLEKYKTVIFDNRDNPLNVFKVMSDISTKRY